MEAYDIALGNAERPDICEHLEQFKDDHIRHADELGKLLADLGGEPNGGPATRQMFPADPIVAASIRGDRNVLEELLSSENDTNAAYERALGTVQANEAAERLLGRNLDDERRHRTWIEETLAAL